MAALQTKVPWYVAFPVIIALLVLTGVVARPVSCHGPMSDESRRRATCVSNIRYIGFAMVLYALDHNDRYPDSFAALLKDGYVPTTKVFVCPSSGHNVPGDFPKENFKDADLSLLNRVDEWCDYVMVRGVTPDSPRDFILLHEKRGSHKGEGTNCFFNDGHTQWIPEAEFQEHMKAQQAALNERIIAPGFCD